MSVNSNSNTSRLVLRMAGPNRETVRLFALKVQRLDPEGQGRNVRVAEVK